MPENNAPPTMTYDEKLQLGLDIANLPADKLHGVVEIIMRGEPRKLRLIWKFYSRPPYGSWHVMPR